MAAVTHQTKSITDHNVVRSIKLGDFDQFIKALNNGSDVNMRIGSYSVFELACKTPGREKFIEECVKRGALVAKLSLGASFNTNDLSEFNRALRNGANVNMRDRDSCYSVFELACKTPGKKQFIRVCLNHGALVSEKNPKTNEYPIHLAALSFDSDNLSQLLEVQRIFVDQKFEDRTALFLLFEQIDSENWQVVFECIKLLLKYHANINATDENSVSPIELLVTPGNDAWRKEVLDYCLQNYSVNVDFRRKQARKAIEKHFPGTPIPDIDMEKVTVEILRNKLAAGTEDEFLAAYAKFISQTEGHVLREEDCVELLSVAVYRAKLTSAQKLIEGRIVDGKFVGKPALLSGLLAKCCNRGNVPMLEWLLKIIPADETALINEDPLLSLLVKQIDVYKDKNKCPFFKSMGILLNDPRIEIDKIDVKRYTALQYAVKYKIDHAQALLLAKGAYLGGEDLFGDSPVREMDSLLLEKHLDSCVTGNYCKLSDENFEMRINFSNFLPSNRTNFDEDEMWPILKMAQSASKKRLLWHPVISSILLLRWIQLTRLLLINLLFTLIFTASFASMIYLKFCNGQDDTLYKFLYYFSFFGWGYLIVREIIDFLLNKRMYVKSLQNGMEVLLIILSGVVLFGLSSHSAVLVGIILLLGLELTLKIGMLPVDFISTYIVMLTTVFKNFVKCIAVCTILLLSFAFSFYTLFKTVHINGLNKPKDYMTMNVTEDDEKRFNLFKELPLAVIKTLVMLAGEVEASNIPFQISWIIYLLFPLLVFFLTIVMNNLMNGVAVSNVTSIQAESETIGIAKMVFVICRYENAMKAIRSMRRYKVVSWLIPLEILQLFHSNESLRKIMLQPYQPHIIKYNTTSLEHRTIENIENGTEEYELVNNVDLPQRQYTFNANHFFYKPFGMMLEKIVNNAMQILHSRQPNKDSFAFYYSRLEQKLECIVQEQIDIRKEMQSLKLHLYHTNE